MEKSIYVIYIGVAGIRSEDIKDFCKKVLDNLSPKTIEGEFLAIPIESVDSRIECINPKYITDIELIKQHTELLIRLQEELKNQEKLIKQDINK